MSGAAALALLGAAAAALLYGVATVLQVVGVRRLAPSGPWTMRAWSARLYAAGLGLDALGFLASVLALRELPLFVVQSTVAASVAVTALLAVLFLHVRLTRREVVALVAVGAGLVLLALAAAPGVGRTLGHAGAWLVLAGVVPVAALVAAAARHAGAASALAVAAGLGFGGVGIAARVLPAPHPLVAVLGEPLLWALAAYGVLGIVAFGLALQRGSVTTVTAVTFGAETVVPALVGLVWLGDRVRPGQTPAAVAGFVLTLAGCVALAGNADETRLAGPPTGPGY